mgnify:CR=1 FL=1
MSDEIDLRDFIRIGMRDERVKEIAYQLNTIEEIIEYIWVRFNIGAEEGDTWFSASDMLDIVVKNPNNFFDCEDISIFLSTVSALKNWSVTSYVYSLEYNENHAINLYYDEDKAIPIDVTLGKTGTARGDPNRQPIVEWSAEFIRVYDERLYERLL